MKPNAPGATKYTDAIIRRAIDAKAQSKHGLMDAIRESKKGTK